MKFLSSILFFLCAVFALALDGQAGPYRVNVAVDPAVIPVGKAKLTFKVTDQAGKPVNDAEVRAIAQMPGMNMGEKEQVGVPAGEGAYTMPVVFAMAGSYDLKVHIKTAQGEGSTTLPLATGAKTEERPSLWPWAIGVALILFVAYRVRKSGQSLNMKGVVNRGSVTGILVLGVALAIAVYAVNHGRRQGAMTPIEAQAMEMDTPAPEGVSPVTLATAQMQPFGESVRYSGQAVGFVEQDVTPRVTGTIQSISVYVGDRVRKGQLLAKLDVSQQVPMVNEKAAMVDTARQGVTSAQADYRQAQAMIRQAEAERGQYNAALAEAKANVQAASEGLSAMKEMVRASEAEATDARSRVDAAKADASYWDEELKRMAKLYSQGVVSRDEYEREKTEATKAQSMLRQAQEGVKSAEAKVRSAEAQVRQGEAMLVGARRKVASAQSELHIHHSHVNAAVAASESAKAKVFQSNAMVRQAQAGLAGAAVNLNYAELRAETDGLVTQRLISPGTLVNPGQVVLKVAQVKPIRLQANVAERDLARIRPGNSVKVLPREGKGTPVVAKVSSVAPSVDPLSRTGVVEAIVENANEAFLTGQFVSMEILIGTSESRLVIPETAVQTSVVTGSEVVSTNTKSAVWVATPATGGYRVERRDVQLGDHSGGMVEVREGLKPGEKVVVTGASNLQAGQTVVDSSPAPAATGVPTVSVTSDGFNPPSVTLTAGQRKIIFIRKSDETCGTEVVFPSLKIEKKLPLNEPVTVELPAEAKGELSFSCGMNMLKGKVVVQ